MRIVIVGAAGGVGRRLARVLSANGDEVVGVHRSAEQSHAVTETGATSVLGDVVTDPDDALDGWLAGAHAVVYTAGAHGTGAEHTTAIDGEGPGRVAGAARRTGVHRFVLVSAFPEAGRGGEVREGFEHYMRVKKAADVALAATDLDWVIVRPGTLTDDPGTGRVSLGPAVGYGTVARDDVAAVLAAVLHRSGLTRRILELTAGDIPVEQAVAASVPSRPAD